MKLKTKICPKCRSNQIISVAGAEIGMWECVRCRYRAAIFPVIEIDTKKVKQVKNKKIKDRGGKN